MNGSDNEKNYENKNNVEDSIQIETDLNGLPWALVEEVKEYDILSNDGGFHSDPEEGKEYNGEYYCILPNTKSIVWADEKNELFVLCSHGRHYLEGQYEDRNETVKPFYIGFYKEKK